MFDATRAIAGMKTPGERGIIQVIVTNRCDLADCSNCTQMIPHHKERWVMPPDLFRRALESLADYPGVIGVFGGNPTVHPAFDELCAIMREVIPERRRRGLWTNRLNGRSEAIRQTFGYFNLNVHGNPEAAAEMEREVVGPLLAEQPAGLVAHSLKVWGTRPSRHAPVLVALEDLVPDEAERWALIARCDINQRWSGAITLRRGNLRAYFCEVAASFEGVYDTDTGLAVEPGWWRRPMMDYEHQVRRWCPSCGVPLRLAGHEDLDFIDDVSARHVGLTVAGRRPRPYKRHDTITGPRTHEATDYQELRKAS